MERRSTRLDASDCFRRQVDLAQQSGPERPKGHSEIEA